ncbi:MAG: hypothetical protein RQ930_00250 [Candidatus Aenigmarchaeota archaeon]|nr:hypothetical protein [Candidatus Aenigmarchaeota archaeon]
MVEFHLLIRKAANTVYPVPIAFGSSFLAPLRATAWYDNNIILKAMVKAGYLPLVKPNKVRGRKNLHENYLLIL